MSFATSTRIAALGLALAMEDCPESGFDAPLAEASTVAFDTRLVGTWRCLDDRTVDTLTFTHQTPTVLLVRVSGDTSEMRFHSAKSGKTPLANLSTRVGAKEQWNLVRPALAGPNALVIEIADDKHFKNDSLPKSRAAIAAALKRGDLFADAFVCKRALL